jgi:hypothetical protein
MSGDGKRRCRMAQATTPILDSTSTPNGAGRGARHCASAIPDLSDVQVIVMRYWRDVSSWTRFQLRPTAWLG